MLTPTCSDPTSSSAAGGGGGRGAGDGEGGGAAAAGEVPKDRRSGLCGCGLTPSAECCAASASHCSLC